MKKLALLVSLLIFGCGPALARTVNIEYILDASGSMIEMMGQEQKIEIAKRTLRELVDRLPAAGSEVDLNVGLRIYGHLTSNNATREERCRDTALEVPIEGLDLDTIKNKIAGLNARGWTPIAYSLRQARNDFPAGAENDNIIILVSDGKETCGGDPCAVAKELHEAGIAVKIHVVGFDIKPEERKELECIAAAAGGQYFSADSAAGLSEALGKAQEVALKQESESVRITIAGPGTLRFAPASWVPGAPYRFRVESAAAGTAVASGGGSLEDLMLPAGTYRLVWDQTEHEVGEVVLADNIEIKPRQTTTLHLDSGVNLVPSRWIEEPPYYWYLKDPKSGEKVITVGRTWDPILVPAGTYELWYRQWEHYSSEVLLAENLEVKEGSVNEVDVNTGVVLVPADRSLRAPYNWVLADSKTGREIAKVGDYWGPLPVPPGDYSLSLRQTEHGHTLTELIPSFPVKEGQLVEIGL